jgi:DNA-binding NtrC family response regulator
MKPVARLISRTGALERQAIEQAMREVGGNKVRAAKQLGISRMQLYGRLRKFGLDNE